MTDAGVLQFAQECLVALIEVRRLFQLLAFEVDEEVSLADSDVFCDAYNQIGRFIDDVSMRQRTLRDSSLG